ncbi:hypothetical protein Vafri_15298 [Volvox africanus]|uniref:Sialate O-acetylesterase domain-containing protein n=1 Tax=Volvox africanus TaxID=51714 RepID=A0A8J4BGF6_9CHLO|nr:hypothetical protein Vafri_15298 [Volvox africanus]
MGARQSTYLVDAHEPQPQQASALENATTGLSGARRPPPLNLTASPTPRRRAPICSALETVDIASTHPHSPAPSPAAIGLVDVWIVAGQSNAVGENAADGTSIPHASQPLPGLVMSYDSTGAWRDATPNIHAGIHGYSQEPSCGPGISFGRALVSLGLSGRVGLVPTAKGATNLFHDWKPAGGGDLYGTMISRTKAAMSAPLPGGGTCRLRGMIWVQGEADAEEKVGNGPSEAYGANFTAFVQAVRRDLASYHAQLPVIIGVMALRKRDCFPYLAAVRRAQLGVPIPGLLRVDLAGYEFFEEYGGFHVHLTKDGATALGAAMAHTYYSAVVRAGLPRRPGDTVTAAAVTAFALGPGAFSGSSAMVGPAATKPHSATVAVATAGGDGDGCTVAALVQGSLALVPAVSRAASESSVAQGCEEVVQGYAAGTEPRPVEGEEGARGLSHPSGGGLEPSENISEGAKAIPGKAAAWTAAVPKEDLPNGVSGAVGTGSAAGVGQVPDSRMDGLDEQ